MLLLFALTNPRVRFSRTLKNPLLFCVYRTFLNCCCCVLWLFSIGRVFGSSTYPGGTTITTVDTFRTGESMTTTTNTTASDVQNHPPTMDFVDSIHPLQVQQHIAIVFSDLDGTLIHYPEHNSDDRNDSDNNDDKRNNNNDNDYVDRIVKLPPSSTGMTGIISTKTIHLCRSIREQQYIRSSTMTTGSKKATTTTTTLDSLTTNASTTKLIFVSGMRATTLIKRLPFLPKADAYCCEAGGRIFYPKGIIQTSGKNHVDEDDDDDSSNDKPTRKRMIIQPVPFYGATPDDLQPYELIEDMVWRKRIEAIVGSDSYIGNEAVFIVEDVTIPKSQPQEEHQTSIGLPNTTSKKEKIVPIEERNGSLWEYARYLLKMGCVIDTDGYSSCFRVNRKQQKDVTTFDELLERDNHASTMLHSLHLTTSTNLGCIDYYPICSGKRNCCDYLAKKFIRPSIPPSSTTNNFQEEFDDDVNDCDNELATRCLCLCDDDNDVEMAISCLHAYLPTITSSSMAHIVQQNPSQFTVMKQQQLSEGEDTTTTTSYTAVDPTILTEMALQLVLDRIQEQKYNIISEN